MAGSGNSSGGRLSGAMRAARSVALAAGIFGAAITGACGGGGGDPADSGSSSVSASDVKATMSALLQAATKGEAGLAGVEGRLAPELFLGHHMTTAPKPWDQIPAAEQRSALQSCFNQVLAVANATTLRDAASIDAALAAGKINVHAKTRSADVEFHGPAADGKGPAVKFKAKLAQSAEGMWRLVVCEPQYGR